MKALFTSLLLLLAIFQTAQGQVVIDNFESNRIAQYGYRDGTLSTVANPAQSGINTSSQVGRYVRNGAAQYDVIRIQVPGYYNDVTAYTTGARTLRMKVYSPAAGVPVQLSFEDTNRTTPSNYPTGRYCVVSATTTRANQWEELTFSSPFIPDRGTSPQGINVILLSFNINSFSSGTYYFDDVQVPDYTAFNLVWSEEFSGSSLDRNNWNVEVNDNGGGNNELQFYTDRTDNIQVSGGNLNLIAKRENYGSRQYTSGRINSSGLAGVLYGRIKVRAKIPVGQGFWPAIWMLPTDWAYGGWPNSGEIDIMENLGHETNKVYSTIHYANPNYTYNSQSITRASGNYSDDFHVYEVAWTPTRINFLVDSVQISSIPFQGRPFDRRFHMVLNIAVGGNWPGSPNGSTVFPATFSVDYVRMYSSQFLCDAPTTPTIGYTGSPNFCEGGSRTLIAPSGFTYLWSTGETTRNITVTNSGSYSVRTIRGICTSAASTATVITVTPNSSQPTITYTGSTTFCAGSSLLLSAPTGFTYLWSNGATTRSITASTSGTYSVQTIANGCTSIASNPVPIIVTDLPQTPTITGASSFCVGSSTTLTSSAATGNLWSNNATTQSITVNSIGTYSVRNIANNCTSATSGAITVTSQVCNQIFTGNGNFNTSANWNSGIVPNSGTDVVINGNMVVSSPLSLRNVSVGALGSVTISSGTTFNVIGNLANDGQILGEGTLRLSGSNNQAFGGGIITNLMADNAATIVQNAPTQITDLLSIGSNTILNFNNVPLTLLSSATKTARLGQVPSSARITNASQFTVQRYLNPNFTRSALYGRGNYYFTGPVVKNQTVDLWNSVSPYGPETFTSNSVEGSRFYFYNTASNSWRKPTSLNQSLPAGTGAQVWFGTSAFFNNGQTTWSVSGEPVIGNFAMPLVNMAGFQLLSNPYPSSISWTSSSWTKQNIASTIYVYDWVNQRYRTYNNGLQTNGGTNILGTAQGFIVQATSNTPLLTAAEGIKVTNSQAMQRSQDLVGLIRLQLANGAVNDELVLAHQTEATYAYESQYDAQKFFNPTTNIYFPGPPAQSIARMNFDSVAAIPFILKSSTAGNLVLTTTQFAGMEGFSFSLLDLQTNTTIPYSDTTRYSFTVTANQEYTLQLLVTPPVSVKKQNKVAFQLYPNPATNQVIVKAKGAQTIEITNAIGVLVATLPATEETVINLAKYPKGMYQVKAINGNGYGIQKLAVQ